MFRAAVYQGTSVRSDLPSVLRIVEAQLEQASQQEVDIVQFPELYMCGYDISPEETARLAISQGSDEMSALRALAAKFATAVGMGYAEVDNEKIYNSCCLIDATGTIVLNYRKTHLWDPTMEGEKLTFQVGDTLPVGTLFIPRTGLTLTIGILICFDCEFPEPSRVLAMKGASVILISTAICDDYTPSMIIPCRAAENHATLIYSNLVGVHSRFPSSLSGGEGLGHNGSSASSTCFCGQSAIIAPDGRELVRASRTEEGLFVASVDPALYADHKRRNDYLVERRPELYKSLGPIP